jgi:hypothetical protein
MESSRFFKTILFTNVNRKGQFGLPSLFNVFNVGFYYLILSYIKSAISLFEIYCKIYVLYHKDRKRILHIEIPLIFEVLEQSSISSIN